MIEFVKNVMKSGCLLLVISGNMHGAHYARRIIAGASGTGYFALSFSLPIALGKNLLIERKALEAECAKTDLSGSEFIQKFAHEELIRVGLPDASVYPCTISIAGHKHIMLEQDLFNRANASLKYIAEISKEEADAQILCNAHANINELKGVLQHEAHHIIHGDIAWRLLTSSFVASCVPIGLRTVLAGVRLATQQAKKISNMRKVWQGFVNACVAAELYCFASRKIEQQADDAIQSDDALKGMSSYLKEAEERLHDIYKESPWMIWIFKNALTHPSFVSRVEKLQSRLHE